MNKEDRRFFEGLLFALATTFCLMAFVALLVYWPKEDRQRRDCALAEFHPDFTPAQREACRQLRTQGKPNK